MNRRTLLTWQLAFAILALVALALTVLAVAGFVQTWQFSISARDLLALQGSDRPPEWEILGATGSGRVTAVVVPDEAGPANSWSVYLPLIATVVSILGFLSTTLLAWRKERRDTRREALELEHLRLEVEELKRKLATPDATQR
jgi:hypothetical protein